MSFLHSQLISVQSSHISNAQYSPVVGGLSFKHLVSVMDWNMFPQNSDVEDLNPSTSESDLIWSWSPYRSNQVKMRPLGCIWPKVRLVKAMVFPAVIYGCESWTIKKAECWRIDAFELWCWSRLLRVSWTARRSNQSILKEISPECLLEGWMLKLKL